MGHDLPTKWGVIPFTQNSLIYLNWEKGDKKETTPLRLLKWERVSGSVVSYFLWPHVL